MAVGNVRLIRHGRTAYNAAMRLQGQIDIELDEVGLWQAHTCAEVLAGGTKPARILVSDLSRAVETARVIASRFDNVEVIIDERIRERSFGPWEGMTGEEISANWAEEFAQWRGGAEPEVEGIESKSEVAERMLEAIEEHSADLSPKQTLFVVSHGAAISCAIAGFLGEDASQWRGVAGMSNVHWSTVARNTSADAQPAWRLVEHNTGPSVVYGKNAWENGPEDAEAQVPIDPVRTASSVSFGEA
ncbi:histidine phosphatase family protein [Timonella senegalensis]|uniref:histidine phosphatase family protein n=1 Tax=Timonella senegalensis TaxID=1465825 RepID=UPI0002D574DE|nr:histidine phosphatase family protein [Timonella senegalensis]